jgi:hypothetical protein
MPGVAGDDIIHVEHAGDALSSQTAGEADED